MPRKTANLSRQNRGIYGGEMNDPCKICKQNPCHVMYGENCRPHEAYYEIEGKTFLEKLKSISTSSKATPTRGRK